MKDENKRPEMTEDQVTAVTAELKEMMAEHRAAEWMIAELSALCRRLSADQVLEVLTFAQQLPS